MVVPASAGGSAATKSYQQKKKLKKNSQDYSIEETGYSQDFDEITI